ncbi:MAG: helix-turn-helix domain-containing protein [Myxococcota bacterium]
MNKIGPLLLNDRPTVVVFGGAKGGIGRSTMCAEVARSLARQGSRVLCVDASAFCPTLNAFLNTTEPKPRAPDLPAVDDDADPGHIVDFIQATGYKNIWLSSLAAARLYPFVSSPITAIDLLEQLHELDFDWVLVDLPPESDPFCVGLFTLCDVPMIVCTPEPACVRAATQFLRGAIFQAIGYHAEQQGIHPDPVLDLLYALPLDFNLELLQLAASERHLTNFIEATLALIQPYLIVNLVREGAERDLGFVLSHAWHAELGVFPRFLAPVDYEDRRWFYNRRSTGVSSSRIDEALSQDIEKLVRQLVQLEVIDQRFPRPVPDDERTPTAVRLGLSIDTSPNQVRQHCRRIWEGYRREVTVSLVFRDPSRRTHMADVVEALYKSALTLPGETMHPEVVIPTQRTELPTPDPAPAQKRASHDVPSSHESVDKGLSDVRPPSEPSVAPPPPPTSPPSRLASAEHSPGAMLARMRRQQEMSLHELSQRAHIGIKYLTAIEDVDVDFLPRDVYLRGYLREIARIFDIDPGRLIDEYFRMIHELDAERC